jgi:hypothetical protein
MKRIILIFIAFSFFVNLPAQIIVNADEKAGTDAIDDDVPAFVTPPSFSDGRIKKNVKANVPGLDFINLLQPVTYNLDLDALDNLLGIVRDHENYVDREARRAKERVVQSGFIAQDVEKVALELGYNFSGVDAPPKR